MAGLDQIVKIWKRHLVEASEGAIVFTFGRFNPPTIGHNKLMLAAIAEAKIQKANCWIFVSQTQDAKKNPLTVKQKVKILKKMTNFSRKHHFGTDAKTPFEAAEKIADWGYKKVIMVVGSDRVNEFKRAFKPYIDDYGFTSFKVISAGERDPDAAGAAGMSASKMRKAAVEGDFRSFEKGVFVTINAKKLFHAVRKGLGLKKIQIDESKEERHLYKSKAEAEKVAKEFGLTGAHAHGDMWMPGPSHKAFMQRMTQQELNYSFSQKFTTHINEKEAMSKNPIREYDTKIYTVPPDKEIQEWIKQPKVQKEFKTHFGTSWKKEMHETAWKLYMAKDDEKTNVDEHF